MASVHRYVNQRGLDIIKESEGLRLKMYYCPAGKPTIGYGHLILPDEDYYLHNPITLKEAERLLRKDLWKFEVGVDGLLNYRVNDNQFSAVVSFAYNVGLGSLRTSTLLRRINGGDMAAAALEFLRWNKAGGKVLPGLTRRRALESELFLTPETKVEDNVGEHHSRYVAPDGSLAEQDRAQCAEGSGGRPGRQADCDGREDREQVGRPDDGDAGGRGERDPGAGGGGQDSVPAVPERAVGKCQVDFQPVGQYGDSPVGCDAGDGAGGLIKSMGAALAGVALKYWLKLPFIQNQGSFLPDQDNAGTLGGKE